MVCKIPAHKKWSILLHIFKILLLELGQSSIPLYKKLKGRDMKCHGVNLWQCDEARTTEPVSVHSMLRAWKLTDKVRTKDWSLIGRKRGMGGGSREGLSGIMGYWDDKRRDSVALSTLSLGPTRGGLPETSSWGHPGTRSARHIKSASPCVEPFVQQNPAWPASPLSLPVTPTTLGSSANT